MALDLEDIGHSITLKEITNWDENLPHVFKIKQGPDGPHKIGHQMIEDNQVMICYQVMPLRVAKATIQGSSALDIPLDTSWKFGVLPRKGVRDCYQKMADLLDADTLPECVATMNATMDYYGDLLEAGTVLFLREISLKKKRSIFKSSKGSRVMEFRTPIGNITKLRDDCAAGFSTKPSDVKLPLAQICSNLQQLPATVQCFASDEVEYLKEDPFIVQEVCTQSFVVVGVANKLSKAGPCMILPLDFPLAIQAAQISNSSQRNEMETILKGVTGSEGFKSAHFRIIADKNKKNGHIQQALYDSMNTNAADTTGETSITIAVPGPETMQDTLKNDDKDANYSYVDPVELRMEFSPSQPEPKQVNKSSEPDDANERSTGNVYENIPLKKDEQEDVTKCGSLKRDQKAEENPYDIPKKVLEPSGGYIQMIKGASKLRKTPDTTESTSSGCGRQSPLLSGIKPGLDETLHPSTVKQDKSLVEVVGLEGADEIQSDTIVADKPNPSKSIGESVVPSDSQQHRSQESQNSAQVTGEAPKAMDKPGWLKPKPPPANPKPSKLNKPWPPVTAKKPTVTVKPSAPVTRAKSVAVAAGEQRPKSLVHEPEFKTASSVIEASGIKLTGNKASAEKTPDTPTNQTPSPTNKPQTTAKLHNQVATKIASPPTAIGKASAKRGFTDSLNPQLQTASSEPTHPESLADIEESSSTVHEEPATLDENTKNAPKPSNKWPSAPSSKDTGGKSKLWTTSSLTNPQARTVGQLQDGHTASTTDKNRVEDTGKTPTKTVIKNPSTTMPSTQDIVKNEKVSKPIYSSSTSLPVLPSNPATLSSNQEEDEYVDMKLCNTPGSQMMNVVPRSESTPGITGQMCKLPKGPPNFEEATPVYTTENIYSEIYTPYVDVTSGSPAMTEDLYHYPEELLEKEQAPTLPARNKPKQNLLGSFTAGAKSLRSSAKSLSAGAKSFTAGAVKSIKHELRAETQQLLISKRSVRAGPAGVSPTLNSQGSHSITSVTYTVPLHESKKKSNTLPRWIPKNAVSPDTVSGSTAGIEKRDAPTRPPPANNEKRDTPTRPPPASNETVNLRTLKSLDCEGVQSLLEAMNLSSFKKSFLQNQVDGELLSTLKEEELEELGLAKSIQQKRLMQVISGQRSVKDFL